MLVTKRIGNRLLALALDIIIFGILVYFSFQLVGGVFLNSDSRYVAAVNERNKVYTNTQLLFYDDTTSSIRTYKISECLESIDSDLLIHQKLQYFYCDYLNEHNVDSFNQEYFSNKYFVSSNVNKYQVSADFIDKEGEVIAEVKNYIRTIYSDAIYRIYGLDEYKTQFKIIINCNKFISMWFEEISIVIFFIIIPYIKLEGTTLGQKLLRIRLGNKDGERLKWYQILSRYIIWLILPVYFYFTSGWFSFIYPICLLLVNIILLVVYKGQREFFDILGVSYLLEESNNKEASLNTDNA